MLAMVYSNHSVLSCDSAALTRLETRLSTPFFRRSCPIEPKRRQELRQSEDNGADHVSLNVSEFIDPKVAILLWSRSHDHRTC